MKILQPKFLLLLLLLFVGAVMATPLFVIAHEEDDETDENTSSNSDDDDDDDDDEDEALNEEEDHEEEDAYQRDLDIVVKNDRIEIESTLKFGENKDEFEIEFRAESGEEPEIELEYSTETDTFEAEFDFEVEFEQIIEYLDNGTANGYQDGEEVSVYEIGETDWNDIVHEITNVSGSIVNTFTASTTDGVFVIVLKISGSIIDLGNATLTPNSIKIDIEIHDFPYVSNSTDTKLAIKAKIETEAESEVKDESTEETEGFSSQEAEVFIGNMNAQGFFSWAEYALVDGSNATVIASALEASDDSDDDLEEGETSGTIFFSFNASNAKDIVWDPKVGVQSQATQEQLLAIEEKYSILRTAVTTENTEATDDGTKAGLPGFELWLVFSIVSLFAGITRIGRREK